MRALFVSAPLPGHLDWGGYLRTAAALQAAGANVLWASGAAVARQVAQAGVPFVALNETGWRWPPPPPLPPPGEPDERAAWQKLRAMRALDQWLDEARVAAAVEELTAVADHFKPDLVVSEMFVAAAGLVAERRHASFVVAGWPAVAAATAATVDELSAVARARLERLLARWNLTGTNWTVAGPAALRSPSLHLTYWSPAWHRGLALLPQTAHVGGAALAPLPPDPTLPDPQDQPWVLITLGTSFDDDPAFFAAAAVAADQLGCCPLLVGQQFAQRPAPGLPARAVVRDHVDFRQVLPYTAAAIHHGGAGTTHALALHGIPQIVSPHAADQGHQARGIERSGAGIHLPPRSITVTRLVATLATILPDLAPQRQCAGQLQAEMAGLGGVGHAAELLLKFERLKD